jgi:hypothetical protein
MKKNKKNFKMAKKLWNVPHFLKQPHNWTKTLKWQKNGGMYPTSWNSQT